MSTNITIRDGYALFWGQWPSNWAPSPFVVDGVTYNCVEQYMMAEKARTFGDEVTLAKIMASPEPRDQQSHGRTVRGYDDAKWASVRYQVVLRATIEKYRQNPDLLEQLLATGDVTFVECSPVDRIWGIGMRASDSRATNPSMWLGTNLLGKAITEARRVLRQANPR
jgi:ribA/ribD-fused uncharacterized protein